MRRVKRSKRITRRRRTSKKQRGGSSSPPSSPPIKVFTSADKRRPTLDALEASCVRHGYDFEVIGLGKPWGGFKTKMENYVAGIQAYRAQKGDTALAVFMDGFDTLCIQSAEQFVKKYARRPRAHLPIVMGAEVACYQFCDYNMLAWYDHHKIPGGKAARVAKAPSPSGNFHDVLAPEPMFLNSGLIVGPAKHLEELFLWMLNKSGTEDDQLAATHYLMHNMDNVDLDFEENLFRNKILKTEACPDEGTAEGPGFLHFPGQRNSGQQELLLEWFQRY